jgi:hypothetical protein
LWVGGKFWTKKNKQKCITAYDMNPKKSKKCTSAQVAKYEQKKTSKTMLVQKIWAKENKQEKSKKHTNVHVAQYEQKKTSKTCLCKRYEQKNISKNMLLHMMWAKENKQKCISANKWK